MSTTPLREFATKVRANNRLGFGDLRRLQRDVLPNGPATREDVEILVAIDATVRRLDAGWAGYVVAAITDFAASSDSPGGPADDRSDWLNEEVLARSSRRTAALIARELARTLRDPDDTPPARPGARRKPRALSGGSFSAAEPRDAAGLLCTAEG